MYVAFFARETAGTNEYGELRGVCLYASKYLSSMWVCIYISSTEYGSGSIGGSELKQPIERILCILKFIGPYVVYQDVVVVIHSRSLFLIFSHVFLTRH